MCISRCSLKEGTLHDILYAVDLVLIAETMAALQKDFILGKVLLRVKT